MRRIGFACVLATGSLARAGGLELPVHGVHSLERAGALVAGAADPDALWLDPAGLAHLAGDGHRALLFDIAYLYQPVDYTPATGPKVGNQQPGAPVPSLAGAIGIGDRLVVAGGIAWHAVGVNRYDPTGPQRYAAVATAGSAFVTIAAGAAYAVSPRLRLGATLQDMVSVLDTQLVVSACPPQVACMPGDAGYDSTLHVRQTGYLSPSGSLGVQYDASSAITLGLTVQAPTRVTGSGTLAMTLPASPTFSGAMVTGSAASVRFWLPPSARAGVSWHATPALEIEAALDVELWSLHDAIEIAPDHVQLGAYPLQTIEIPRELGTSISPSLGGELHVGDAAFGAGLAYETAATPRGDVSVLTVDSAKWIVGAGGGYAADGWQLGVAAGFVRLADVSVSAADARVPVLDPFEPASARRANAGTYRSYDVLAGLRAARRF